MSAADYAGVRKAAPIVRAVRLTLAAAFVVQLPAEAAAPIITVGPLGITNLELTAYVFVAIWAVGIATGLSEPPRLLGGALLLLALTAAAAAVASVFALYDAGASLKVLLRLGGALLVGTALASEIIQHPRHRPLLGEGKGVFLVITAALGIVEYATGWQLLGGLFALFRDAPVTLGGFLVRATGTLLHPNLAAWYWGLAGVAAIAVAVSLPRSWAVTTTVVAVAPFVAAVLALSRGALIGTGVTSIVAAAILIQRGTPLRRAFVVAVPLVVAVAVAAAASPLVRARLISETDHEWYRFSVEAPADVELAERTTYVPVVITNESPVTWPSTGVGAVVVSYHLVGPDGEYLVYEGRRTPLPKDLRPDESVTVRAAVNARPTDDRITIEWDLEQVGQTWFSVRYPRSPQTTSARVTYDPPTTTRPPVAGPDVPSRDHADVIASRGFNRIELWRIALQMIAAHPVTGIGLDNFRLGYGEWVGLESWDTTFNTNNLYLEVFVGIGVSGMLLFAVAAVAVWRAFRRSLVNRRWVSFMAVLVLVSFGVHGLFDAFLTYSTAMYLVATALMIGIWRFDDRYVRRC